MFQWPFDNENSIASPYTWVYFVVTIPLTLLVYAAWILWFKSVPAQVHRSNRY